VHHVLFLLVDVGEMSGVVQSDPFYLLDIFKEWLHCYVLSFVLDSINQQRWSFDLCKLRYTSPRTEGARYGKLAPSIPSSKISIQPGEK
jgi:hypothetical protein